MLTCRHVMHLSSDYLDGTLPWHRRLGIRLHLFICDACRRYLRQLRATAAVLGSWPLPEVTEDALQHQMELLRKQP